MELAAVELAAVERRPRSSRVGAYKYEFKLITVRGEANAPLGSDSSREFAAASRAAVELAAVELAAVELAAVELACRGL